jgi:hypothetical protein
MKLTNLNNQDWFLINRYIWSIIKDQVNLQVWDQIYNEVYFHIESKIQKRLNIINLNNQYKESL